MATVRVLFVLALAFCCWVAQALPQTSSVWPQPLAVNRGSEVLKISPFGFKIVSRTSSEILQKAIKRYTLSIFNYSYSNTDRRSIPDVRFLEVIVDNDADERLDVDASEFYTLKVHQGNSTLRAGSVWGALRGLQTFSQLVVWEPETENYSIMRSPITIQDVPRYAWRGLMIDSARHFLDISTIRTVLDGMEVNKLNVLHWHMSDAESFSFQSQRRPALSKQGAWANPKNPGYAVQYTSKDVSQIVQYAKERGIRVVPEFDVPGHCYSWGKAYPTLVADCPIRAKNINNVALIPTEIGTYTLINDVFGEVASVFPDKFFHTGGDEVIFGCWNEDVRVQNYMREHGYTDIKQLQGLFETRVHQIVQNYHKQRIVWHDVFENGNLVDPANTLVQVWLDGFINETVTRGIKSILSAPWYINTPGKTWKDFYNAEPETDIPADKASFIIGGEACIWGEVADSWNLNARIWPMASATAERLWSSKHVTDVADAQERLVDLRCRLIQRRVPATPLRPDYCPNPLIR